MLLGIIICCSFSLGGAIAFANESDNPTTQSTTKDDMDVTLGEIESTLMDHLKQRGLNYSLHSEELSNYLYDQLVNRSDKELEKLESYENILAYASEYIYRETLPNDSRDHSVEDIDSVSDLTLNDIKDIVDEENLETEQLAIESHKNIQPTPRAMFTNNHVANYARTFAFRYNPAYANYDSRGGDCTNFASQALRAGGAKDGVTGYPTYINWSSKRSNLGLADSAAWINANSFRQYWQVKGRSVTRHTSKSAVSNTAKLGDILNYANKKTGRSWHNAIVTEKKGGTLYVSQHSSNRNNDNWNNIPINFGTDYVYVIRAL
ncbi:amidase domain-containing protein [Enterococcus quebecensis]